MRSAAALLVFFSTLSLLAQTAAPAFGVASVRPNRSDDSPASRFPLGAGDAYVPGALFSATNQPLIAYVRFAFKLGQGDLLDLPGWVYTDGFDIEARSAGNPSKDQMRMMMRSLLEKRFGLRSHLEPRTKPVFALELASAGKTGPVLVLAECARDEPALARLRLPPIPCGGIGPLGDAAPGMARLGGHGVHIEQIADIMANPATGVDRPVTDRTGLTGTFDFSLEWSPAPDRAQIPSTSPADATGLDAGPGGPTFREALQKQLGLKLVSTSGSVDVLVIDRLEHPQEN